MKTYSMNKLLSLLLCIVLIAAAALFVTGCNDATPPTPTGDKPEATVLGEGATTFYFTVVDKDSAETHFEIHTDATNVGEALSDLELIDGEQGDYGLYVKTVNGTTLDWDTDGMYWAFYVNGESSLTGVDQVEITAGATYTFKAE